MEGVGGGERGLWVAVVIQAMKDFSNGHRKGAVSWFLSDQDTIGSYRWIATMLDLKLSGAEIVERLSILERGL